MTFKTSDTTIKSTAVSIMDMIPEFMRCSGRAVVDDTTISVVPCVILDSADTTEQPETHQKDSIAGLVSITDSESCSVDDSWCSFDSNPADDMFRHRVRFAEAVTVRDYPVTLGDHPFCRDGLPLTLDWEYESERTYSIDQSKSRGPVFTPPRRLSYSTRRRLLSDDCDNMSESLLTGVNTCIQNKPREPTMTVCQIPGKVQQVLDLLNASWAMNTILPAPDLSDIDDLGDADISTTTPLVVHWKRNKMNRSSTMAILQSCTA